MNDKIRIGSASVPKTAGMYYPFMVRTSKNNIAYGMLRPNLRAKNPRVSSTQIFMFDTTSTRTNGMVKVGSLEFQQSVTMWALFFFWVGYECLTSD